ncbi:2,3-bisphosphoglycerate-dependent phosphoglycerate mutase [Alkalibacillus filiformis]|uniref:2,3-bisphosphoglycerate-dependent phosphoglycerate mutase n=1 Tax=Alkalibacillus filiformis TaxID=200990 RepID=A0ABU0DSQ3_9BACI|nr:histidine phosphatase family protein [Alkalibacillus filiformis]MDQ0351341.1 2,3-bisphosphoglycerate-dependent phosphoglycerate mutase [Alkalibacillus filiformis]
MELLIVRHGQSVADIENRHEGRADFPLTDLGKNQAANLAAWIRDHYEIDRIISSPLKRALTTAETVSGHVGVSVEQDSALMEWNNGQLAGELKSEAKEKYPLPKEGRKRHDELYECESMINFRARIETFWSKLMETEAERIVIVAHGGTINMLYQSFMNLPMDTNVVLHTGDTGVHLWQVKDNKRIIKFSNSQVHL